MPTLEETLALVTSDETVVDGAVTLINGLRQQIADALSGVTIPPVVQAKIDSVFDGVTRNKTKLEAALTANVPTE